MTKNQKVGLTVGVVAGLGGAFALGWFLHKSKTATGQSLVHFSDPADGVISYKVTGQSNIIQDWTYNSVDLTLPDGEYWVAMSPGG